MKIFSGSIIRLISRLKLHQLIDSKKNLFLDGKFGSSTARRAQRKAGFQLTCWTPSTTSRRFMETRPTMQLTGESRKGFGWFLTLISPESPSRAVIRELVETEEEFGKDLQAVVERYIKTIDKPEKKVPRIVRDSKDLIFMNFQQIADFHNT